MTETREQTIQVAPADEWLRSRPTGEAFCCVTSPPYWGLRDYGSEGQFGLEATPTEYVDNLVAVFGELRRVLRDDGALWLNIGDSYATGAGRVGDCPGGGDQGERWSGPMTGPNRLPISGLAPGDLVGMPWQLAFALRETGWTIRSEVVWWKPNPMPESVNGWRWERHKVKVGNNGRGGERQRQETGQQDHDGRDFRPDATWKFCPGCEKCVANDGLILRKGSWRPTSSHEKVFMLTGPGDYFGDAEAVRETIAESSFARIQQPTFRDQTGGPKDYRHGTNTSRSARRALENFAASASSGRNLRNVWTITTAPMSWELCRACKRVYSGAEFRKLPRRDVDGKPEAVCECGTSDSWLSHFATFPPDLVRPCIRSTCPERVCVECGEPWARVVATVPSTMNIRVRDAKRGVATAAEGYAATPEEIAHYDKELPGSRRPLGLRPTCSCGADWEPGLVIDPFMGSGTVGLVAEWEGRRWAGCDLNPDYVILATERIRRESRPSEAEAERVGQMALWN